MFIAGAASAASDYLLKIKGVDGEDEGKSADGQIEVSFYSWGVSQSSGKHIKQVELTGTNTRYVLEDVVVSSRTVSGNQRRVEFRGHVTLMK
jgi:type VI protein secretion system component Hcp